MADPPLQVPPDLLKNIGTMTQGWNHLQGIASADTPTALLRARMIRTTALQHLNSPRRRPRHQ